MCLIKKGVLIVVIFVLLGSSSYGIKNPAAVYCNLLNYTYKTILTDNGEEGICAVGETQFDAWDFFVGKVGQNYSYCHKNGYEIVTLTDGQDPYSPIYGACVTGTSELKMMAARPISLTKLLDLPNKVKDEESRRQTPKISAVQQSKSELFVSLPSTLDYRKYQGKNWITSIKDQGTCGSCWAFATVAGIESAVRISRRQPDLNIDLAEEYLVSDCCTECGNCEGGRVRPSLQFANDQGIPDEACFPYTATDQSCSNRCDNWNSRLVKISGFGQIYQDPDAIKSHLVQNGPMPACFYVDGDWYTPELIYKCQGPPYNPDTAHCILLIGYNDSGGYWLFKNSWGTGNWSIWDKIGYDQCDLAQSEVKSAYYIQMDNDKDGYTHDVDCNDMNSNIHPGATETCNNIDDNCDGIVDGITKVCGYNNVGSCTMGTQLCTNGKWGSCTAVMPTTEVCNNQDDDCDGKIDEALQRPCSASHKGLCAIGTETCNNGLWQNCPTPKIEVCDNGIDEDCDGSDLLCKCTIISPQQKGYNTSRMTLNVHCPNSYPYVKYSLNNGKSYTPLCTKCGSYNKSTTFSEGTKEIIVTSFDKQGKELFKSDTTTFFIDTKKPLVSAVTPTRGVSRGPMTVSYTEENLKSITLYYGSLTSTKNACSPGQKTGCCNSSDKCIFNVSLKPYENKTIIFYYKLEDKVGHKTTSNQYRIMVDTISPVIKIKTNVIPGNLNLNASLSEKADLTYKDVLDAKARTTTICTNCLGTSGKFRKIGFRKGNHKLLINATDEAGNSGTQYVSFTIS